ncbi:MAG: hypothetical protein C4522_08760 [Desulfobacteraceae bacterium]|nr:MAG: hypothetical protein C4522_08760 [Desulfobacteraceae bacterium]
MARKNDIVLIYFEDNPVGFARVEDILPDHKKDWYHIKLLMLQIPLQTVTWILKDIYIEGTEFTMNGNRMRLEKVVAPEENDPPKPEGNEPKKQSDKANVISLHNRK